MDESPYGRGLIEAFIAKLVKSQKVSQWMLITNNCTETSWFHRATRACSAVCFPASRCGRSKNDGGDRICVINARRGVMLGSKLIKHFGVSMR